MADSTVARSDGDVFELHIHVVFRCGYINMSADHAWYKGQNAIAIAFGFVKGFRLRTFNELASINLPRRDFECHNMVLESTCCQRQKIIVEDQRI